PSLTAEELHGNRLQWLYAIDVLIETQGEVCLLPLPGDAAERLFPSVRFRVRERSRHKSALVMQKYSRQQAREAEQKARAYQALVAQAEIELAFHSPETVGSWHARWSDRVAEHDLETLFWQWGERFPSLAGMERWQWQDMPFWQVIAEASMAAREAGHVVREMERWMVPNKLREVA
ncbi:TPA: plasmid SOS inhibition protein A, partial [Escherichia coli]|nr:plasmid SOS inhibition protein A [Escherichia coli]